MQISHNGKSQKVTQMSAKIRKMKLWIYEIQIFELRNEEINVKKILAVINATYAVAKRKPEKIRLAGIRTLAGIRSGFESRQAWFFQVFFSQLRKLR